MNILKEINNKLKGAEGRIREEIIYAAVMKEIKSGSKREGLWAKALSESEGNKAKTESLYIKYRVQSIEDELQVEEEKLEAKEAKKTERVTEAYKRTKRAAEHKDDLRRTRIMKEIGFFGIWLPRILIIGPYVAVYFFWDILNSRQTGSVYLTQSEISNFGPCIVICFLIFQIYILGKLFGHDLMDDRNDIPYIVGLVAVGFILYYFWYFCLWLFG